MALLLLGAVALSACKPTGTTPVADGSQPPVLRAQSADAPPATERATAVPSPHSKATTTTAASPGSTASSKPKPKASSSSASGPRIVSFRIAQKPKCAEGTAVFRAKAVPLVIEWKIAGATSGALSVDDNTHTAGTYGPVDLKGTEEFTFTCAGAVGTVETHTYAIYTVGGGMQKSKTIKVSAKVLDKGPNTP